MANKDQSSTRNNAAVDQDDLHGTKTDDLRREAKEAGVSGTSNMRKDDLVREVSRIRSHGEDAGQKDRSSGPGPDEGRVRKGKGSSSSLKYSQEVTSPDDEPERPGRSLVTTNHQVIKEWAEARGATPATVEGTEHGDHLGVLRFDFDRNREDLRQVSWDEWFDTFDARRLNFIYQEETTDGRQSNFFLLENPDREDA
jgi:hypothetical protein